MDILFVEDHDESRTVISKILAGCGHHVTPAASIEEALRLLTIRRFDVLVSDISLPDGSGFELVAEAKKKQRWRQPGVCCPKNGNEACAPASMST
jgi:two-component system, NtrC family, response regulator PilR